MDDSQEALIRREDAHTPGQRVSLHESLTHMLAENLDDATSTGIGELIPLEVTVGRIKNSVKLVAFQLIGRE